MRFCEALDDLQTMVDCRVRRPNWTEDEWLEAPRDKLMKTLRAEDRRLSYSWTPTQADMFADDWELIDAHSENDDIEVREDKVAGTVTIMHKRSSGVLFNGG